MSIKDIAMSEGNHLVKTRILILVLHKLGPRCVGTSSYEYGLRLCVYQMLILMCHSQCIISHVCVCNRFKSEGYHMNKGEEGCDDSLAKNTLQKFYFIFISFFHFASHIVFYFFCLLVTPFCLTLSQALLLMHLQTV